MKYRLYNGKVELEFDEKKHKYSVDGVQVPSVTTILSVLNKPALMYWSVNEAVGYLKNNWKPGREYDELEIADILEDARKQHTRTKERAATKGSLVHEWIHQYIKWRIENG
jgi:hypothetical protein